MGNDSEKYREKKKTGVIRNRSCCGPGTKLTKNLIADVYPLCDRNFYFQINPAHSGLNTCNAPRKTGEQKQILSIAYIFSFDV